MISEIYSNSECSPIGNNHKLNLWEEEEETTAWGYEDANSSCETKTFKCIKCILNIKNNSKNMFMNYH